MSTSLRELLSTLDRDHYTVAASGEVECWFGDGRQGRRHRVRVSETDDAIRFEATVVGAAALRGAWGEQLHRMAWRRNRSTNLVGFRIDAAGRLVAEATAPNIGLTFPEFALYLRAVAGEADRLEMIMTARDVQ